MTKKERMNKIVELYETKIAEAEIMRDYVSYQHNNFEGSDEDKAKLATARDAQEQVVKDHEEWLKGFKSFVESCE
jgi:hypothetical protein